MKIRAFSKKILWSWGILAIASCAEAQVQTGWRMPEVPETLTAPEDRADYIALRYWGVERGTEVDHEVLEQAFVDFLSVLPYTSGTNIQAEAMDSLVAHTVDIKGGIAMMAEKYLYETESPMLDEGLYQLYLESKMQQADEAEKVRIVGVLEEIDRCKPGSNAPDLEVMIETGRGLSSPQSVDGSHSHQGLLGLAEGCPAVVLFYDHDCEQCQETIAEMLDDSRLISRLEKGEIKVIAVDVDLMEYRTQKRQTPNWYWTSAVGDVEDAYSVRSYPSIYVLSSDGTILIKDSGYTLVSDKIKW